MESSWAPTTGEEMKLKNDSREPGAEDSIWALIAEFEKQRPLDSNDRALLFNLISQATCPQATMVVEPAPSFRVVQSALYVAGQVYVQCAGQIGPDGNCQSCGTAIGSTSGTHMRILCEMRMSKVS
jgi:hypothetical protein